MIEYSKPTHGDYAEYFADYLKLMEDDHRDVLVILKEQGEQVTKALVQLTDEQASYRYAAGKVVSERSHRAIGGEDSAGGCRILTEGINEVPQERAQYKETRPDGTTVYTPKTISNSLTEPDSLLRFCREKLKNKLKN